MKAVQISERKDERRNLQVKQFSNIQQNQKEYKKKLDYVMFGQRSLESFA